ncbi:MAG: hypothetical protein GEV08_01600 [Acidimicrobiia bacterium]|nr:hypothetical protein [Acidimicrobiia bacterium]
MAAAVAAVAIGCSPAAESVPASQARVDRGAPLPETTGGARAAGGQRTLGEVLVDEGLRYGDGGSIDVYRTSAGDHRLVVVFIDDQSDRSQYADLAVALARSGVVVAVADYRPELAAADSGCVVDAALAHVATVAQAASEVALVGFGLGGAVATGQSLGGPWRWWSPSPGCRATIHELEPQSLITISGEFDAFSPGADRTLHGLSPYDQLEGNPYVRIRLVVGSGDEPVTVDSTQRFHAALQGAKYDSRVEVVSGPSGTPVGFGAGEGAMGDPPVVGTLAEIILAALHGELRSN